MFKTRSLADEAFDKLLSETTSVKTTDTAKKHQFLSKVNTNKSKENDDENKYNSPFRNNAPSREQKKQLQDLKTAKFPLVSATSTYNTDTKDVYKDLDPKKNFARDIKFPSRLIDNENRQNQILLDLKIKQDALDRLKDSLQVIDVEDLPRDDKEKGEEEKDSDPVPEQPSNNENITDKDALQDAYDLNSKAATKTDPDIVSHNYSVLNKNNLIDAKDMSIENKLFYLKPIHRKDYPKVQSTTESKFPVASPENKETVVKLTSGKKISKYVYDKIEHDTKVNDQYIVKYQNDQLNKLNKLKSEYNEKIKSIQLEKFKTLNEIENLNLESFNNFEVIQNKLVKNLMDSTATFSDNKVKILRKTGQLKLQKLNELKFLNQKRNLIRREANMINVEKDSYKTNFNYINCSLNEILQELDAKLFKLSQDNIRNENLEHEINKLQSKKQTLLDEIDSIEYKKLHPDDDSKQLELNEMDEQINSKLSNLNLIKQEIINEKLKISKLTNDLNLQLIENKNENLRIMDENTKLNDKIHNMQELHKNELKNLTERHENSDTYSYVTEEQIQFQ
ncbi:hypothetical protein KAFR_0C01960 [Kazachstania africana CBS 2517]|uniref:Uncharacterized protein n=1 Tax=Kazachstania africana (strain ATCC 22294 / BCRC 22015 / CBS 2517 / CECT 1963 / NBRC 1671 / NRRL Y-8276) TaxID=1071382 RepID=H2AS39_KAZAF|nr:hypothetical protein KAFR_0C01960 [Kazachstania africana CBS 2517]CCF57189.1 hypothetical protein KAFR_0C01960 [Kazachstania africana CBS 2517]